VAARSKYHDVKFFLIAIACISAFNYYLTYNHIRFNGFLILTYSLDTVEGWLAWWAVRSIILYLDRKMPYHENPRRRIIVQVLLTAAAGLAVIISLTELVSWIARGRPAVLNFYTYDIFIISIWFLVINGIYIGMHYYHEWQQSEKRRSEEKKLRSGGFSVRQGSQQLLVDFSEILGFYSEAGYTYLQTCQGKKYITDRSLDKTEELLPAELFFRLNRQYIIHRSALTGFKTAGDGKLEIQVKSAGSIPAMVSVSRTRAAQFRKWFTPA
jgi:DNA-binding LytR/AlgR family response regulator